MMTSETAALAARVPPRRLEAAEAPSTEVRGSPGVTAFYLVSALACLTVVVAAAIGAAL